MMYKILPYFKILKNAFLSPRLTMKLAVRDLQTSYVQSMFGLLWVVLEPLIMIGILLFIFGSGVKKGFAAPEVFLPYVFLGIIVYYFFSDALRQGSRVNSKYKFLVKKTTFKLEVLPLVSITSAFFIHVIFLLLVFILISYLGNSPSIYWLQLFLYYIPAIFIHVYALTLFLSALEPFFKDITKIIPIFVRLQFWLTPIFWDVARVPEKYNVFLKLNTLYYLVKGYRESLVGKTPFYVDIEGTIYFWSITFSFLFLGLYCFKKLRPQFAEVV